MPAGTAYNPIIGETPAIVAYARASGTSTAQTVSPSPPDLRSPVYVTTSISLGRQLLSKND